MKDFAPNAEAKWGVDGLNDIFEDKSIHGVAVVVAAQAQVIFYVSAAQYVFYHILPLPIVADKITDLIYSTMVHIFVHIYSFP
mgnify:CR=1 FL=1